MMDLQKYFAALETALVTGGMSEAQSKAYCKRLSTSLQALDETARAEKLASYGSPEDLAKRVLVIANKPKSTVDAPSQNTEHEDTADKKLEHTVNVATNDTPKKRDDVTRPIPTVKKEESDPVPVITKKKTVHAAAEADPTEKTKKPLSKRGMGIFFGTAAVTSPITVTLAAAVLGLFLLIFLALIVIAVAMFVAVTVTVICGILLALVSLGYGIVKMLPGTDAFFIGLYEFGLGMILIGGTIVFPILEYNCATVFVPFTMKKLVVFLKFLVRQIKRLVVYLYDLCRDL